MSDAKAVNGRPLSYVWVLQFKRSERRPNGKYDATCTRPNCGLVLRSVSVQQLEEHVLECPDPLKENIEIVQQHRENHARATGALGAATGLAAAAVASLSDLKAARAKQGTLVQHLGRRLTANGAEQAHRVPAPTPQLPAPHVWRLQRPAPGACMRMRTSQLTLLSTCWPAGRQLRNHQPTDWPHGMHPA
jgi:hypothetical protein